MNFPVSGNVLIPCGLTNGNGTLPCAGFTYRSSTKGRCANTHCLLIFWAVTLIGTTAYIIVLHGKTDDAKTLMIN